MGKDDQDSDTPEPEKRFCGEDTRQYVVVEGEAIPVCDWCLDTSLDFVGLDIHEFEIDATGSCGAYIQD